MDTGFVKGDENTSLAGKMNKNIYLGKERRNKSIKKIAQGFVVLQYFPLIGSGM